ncbi:alpha/beta hydrolase [Nakamurella endophytica]|uniref:Alpha/beta hydrolase n=1 Tax=Nakamurella endophytica TaxID=1748367 RepID=A0A917WEE6_9ACTN|nr:prolyl oligopeptidase family serine peptidase [Nakamurella endophytica]GGL97881.1 hypothetical protein GCM10011594_17200 [Nakamurella endophytica]
MSREAPDPDRPYTGPWTIAAARRFFEPARAPLRVRVDREWTTPGLSWREIRFDVRDGLSSPATVVLPAGGDPVRGVVLAHGGSDDGRRFHVDDGAEMARAGAAVLLPVTRSGPGPDIDVAVAGIRDAVLTLRRALTVLLEWVGAPRDVSYVGHSAGGGQGAYLSAVEPRLRRVVVMSFGAGTMLRIGRGQREASGLPWTDADTAAIDWFDAARYVAHSSAPLLFQHGRHDPVVPTGEARRLYEAAAEPRQWREYDCDHNVADDRAARVDRAAFLAS